MTIGRELGVGHASMCKLFLFNIPVKDDCFDIPVQILVDSNALKAKTYLHAVFKCLLCIVNHLECHAIIKLFPAEFDGAVVFF